MLVVPVTCVLFLSLFLSHVRWADSLLGGLLVSSKFPAQVVTFLVEDLEFPRKPPPQSTAHDIAEQNLEFTCIFSVISRATIVRPTLLRPWTMFLLFIPFLGLSGGHRDSHRQIEVDEDGSNVALRGYRQRRYRGINYELWFWACYIYVCVCVCVCDSVSQRAYGNGAPLPIGHEIILLISWHIGIWGQRYNLNMGRIEFCVSRPYRP